jgi:hypothetical protein
MRHEPAYWATCLCGSCSVTGTRRQKRPKPRLTHFRELNANSVPSSRVSRMLYRFPMGAPAHPMR